jgi:sugar/nucleoside kinase (ribokinase family)
MNPSINLLSDLIQELQQRKDAPFERHAFVGFDGFVETIKRAVKKKENDGNVFFKTQAEFAERISSMNAGCLNEIELITEKIKPGGNASNLANTLSHVGVATVCAGCFGVPEIHPAFAALTRHTHIINVMNPGTRDIIKFEDGEIVLSDLSAFNDYDWRYIKKTWGLEKIEKTVQASQLLAFVDWVNLPHASDIWDGILHDIIKPSGRRDFLFYFDLCDPAQKSTQEIDEVLDLMSCFSPYGKVTLSINENETLKIWAAINGVDIDLIDSKSKIPRVVDAGAYIHKAMNIDYLLVHTTDQTIVYYQHDTIELENRLVRKPQVLTGGGDNLNAGYCLGLMYGLPLPQCVILGIATSGAYIQNGTSPDLNAVLNYLHVWMKELNVKAEDPNVVSVNTPS